MKVVVFQGNPVGGEPDREDLIKYWKEQLSQIDGLDCVDFKGNFESWNPDGMLGDYDIILGAWIQEGKFTREVFDNHPNMKYVATFGHGFGEYDRIAAREHSVTFTNTIYGDVTIAQYAMALLLNICHNIDKEAAYYKSALEAGTGVDRNRQVATRQIELYGKTMGIIGLGSIGLKLAEMAKGFGMNVVAYSRHKKEGPEYEQIEQVSLDELYSQSDVISIHCPLTDETSGMINRTSFSKMKHGVIIINTARGAIIDENALIEAIQEGKVYAAGMDVVVGEPLKEKTPIFDCERTYITSHIAWAPGDARYRTVRLAVENLKNWLQGKPTSVI
jgi:glycerate dehydrogenase